MIVVQLTDPHVSESSSASRERFAAAIGFVSAMPVRPDAVVLTGDVADHGTPREYAIARELLAALPCPAYAIPGNHDDRGALRAAFGPQGANEMEDFVQFVVDDSPLRLVALDTTIPGENGGTLCAARLAWLDARLAEAPALPTLLFMHHAPFATGLDVLDAIGLEGADRFGAVVERHAQVEAIVAGHVHCALVRRFHGTVASTAAGISSRIDFDLSRPERVALVESPVELVAHAWDAGCGLRSHAWSPGTTGPRREIHDGTRWLPH